MLKHQVIFFHVLKPPVAQNHRLLRHLTSSACPTSALFKPWPPGRLPPGGPPAFNADRRVSVPCAQALGRQAHSTSIAGHVCGAFINGHDWRRYLQDTMDFVSVYIILNLIYNIHTYMYIYIYTHNYISVHCIHLSIDSYTSIRSQNKIWRFPGTMGYPQSSIFIKCSDFPCNKPAIFWGTRVPPWLTHDSGLGTGPPRRLRESWRSPPATSWVVVLPGAAPGTCRKHGAFLDAL